jgi:hypothetical protein
MAKCVLVIKNAVKFLVSQQVFTAIRTVKGATSGPSARQATGKGGR